MASVGTSSLCYDVASAGDAGVEERDKLFQQSLCQWYDQSEAASH